MGDFGRRIAEPSANTNIKADEVFVSTAPSATSRVSRSSSGQSNLSGAGPVVPSMSILCMFGQTERSMRTASSTISCT